ncbi:hypothetical protein SAMN05216429_101111 [Marinobacter persicus]|uniref:ClpA/ClpB-like protein n=1 Tax=Marinobacter persicus TaxID=930118 RepID=A0A1I3P887_9GAMM|nr:hypothetical protein [Marinobacter persicus]GHD51276.1 hypothetical protein GCM10008110_22900 [Marinobacter persicus]SFJ17652.1 hypothetical protein SAMN05216429_101111 [Marinobacter persicus]
MEDWQQCLAPDCQSALVLARDTVARHGGYVITAEDFLLALLYSVPALAPFLVRQGVDLDELVRTIQAEQPIVSEVHNDGQLSSQLVYWLSRAREVTPSAWLQWPQLLQVLAHDCERLQDRAYVAVLELVRRWPHKPEEKSPEEGEPEGRHPVPLAMPDMAWQRLAEDITVALATRPRSLAWLHGPEGAGKTTWLMLLQKTPALGKVFLDARSEADVCGCLRDLHVWPASGEDLRSRLLVLDHTSPSALLALLGSVSSGLSELLYCWPGPVLLISRRQRPDSRVLQRLSLLLARDCPVYCTPEVSGEQLRAVASLHQPTIELRHKVQLSAGALNFAASHAADGKMTPGTLLQWLEQAAARQNLFASRGPLESLALDARQQALQSRFLLAMARGDEPCQELETSLKFLEQRLAREDLRWQARKHNGTLRILLTEDLEAEPMPWLAGTDGPVHYTPDNKLTQGETAGARPGNLHS